MKLVDQYKRLVYKTANRVNRRHNGILSMPDLESAGFQALVEAQQTWDESKGALSTWAWFKIRKSIQNEARAQRRALSENITASQGDDAPSCNLVDTLGAPSEVEDRYNREQLHDLLLSQIKRLPPKEQRLMIKMLAQGMTRAEYARQEGVTKAAITYLYNDAVCRLRGMLNKKISIEAV
jgi:RNA polymerase sigma factor (sigma-70 family)